MSFRNNLEDILNSNNLKLLSIEKFTGDINTNLMKCNYVEVIALNLYKSYIT